MKWKHHKKQILLTVWAILFLFSIVSFINSSLYSGTRTFKSGTHWRPTDLSRANWNGLNTVYTLGSDFSFQSIGYSDLSFVASVNDVGYWINATSGENKTVTINDWFGDDTPEYVELSVTSSGTFTQDLYCADKGQPLSIMGTSSYSWNAGTSILTFTTNSPSLVKLSWTGGTYIYSFYGVFDEDTGYKTGTASNVTAYFEGALTEIFEVNGSYVYSPSKKPLYFLMELGTQDRQYWLGATENTAAINIFNQTLTTYTISFIDLAGVLDNHPFVTAQRNINGTMMTVEKCKVDVEKKVQMNLKQGIHYNLVISDGASYTFGDLLMTSTTAISLTLKGINFPQEIITAYRYNRIYAERYNNFSTIKVTYQDTLGFLADVTVDIYFENETKATSTTRYDGTAAFVYTWLLAQYNETYTVRVVIIHSQYGTMNYNSILYRGGYNVRPWSFPLGTIPNLNTADIIPMFILGGCFLIFSKANAYVSGFFVVGMAALMCILGWVSIPASMIMAAFVVVVLLALVSSKRRSYY